MRKLIFYPAAVFALTVLSLYSQAQLKVGDNPALINPKAVLDLESTTKGLLLPRMTTAQRTAITSPPAGLQVYDTTTNSVWYFNGTVWVVSVSNNIYTANGILTGNRTVDQQTNSLNFTSTASTGTSHFTVDGPTFNVDAVNKRIGIGTATPSQTLDVEGNARFSGTVSVGTATPGISSALELESANKALVITRVNNTSAIAFPVNGMLIYDLSSNCIKAFENGAWTNCLSNGSNIEPSTNGTAIVSNYNCSVSSAGIIVAGETVSGVSQTITANVTQLGTYSLNAFANGVVFSASGTFSTLGVQNVVLTAIGTPVNTGTYIYTLNTIPNCSFSRNTISNSTSGGSAVVGNYSCNTASAGTMLQAEEVSGVTQTITANVTTVGTYSITATASGVTFSASGTFTGTGAQPVILNASGTPSAGGNISFPLSTTPNCSFTRIINSNSSFGTAVVSGYNCTGATSNNLTVNVSASTITKVITATVTGAGSYNIQTPVVNGVSWSGSGTFTGTGSQTITLTANGTPTAAGCYTYTLNTVPSCSFTIFVNGNGTTSANASVSCKQIKADFPSSTDGVYWIDLDQCGSSYAATQMYCDMTTSGGGWTLVLKSMANDGSFNYANANWTTSGITLNKTDFNLTGNTNSIYDAYTGLSGSALRVDFLTIPDITINLPTNNSTFFYANNKTIISSSLNCKTTEPSFYGGTNLWSIQRGSTALGTALLGSPARVRLGILADNTTSTDITNFNGWDSGVGLGILGASASNFGSGVVTWTGDACANTYGGAAEGFYKCLVWIR